MIVGPANSTSDGAFQYAVYPQEITRRAPQRKDQKALPDLHQAAGLGANLMLFASLFTVLSPVIPKILSRYFPRSLSKATQKKFLLDKLQDKESTLKLGLRMNSLAGLSLTLYDYETAINTEQPTKIVGKLLHVIGGIMIVFYPASLLLRGINFMGTGLWITGERNDIENSLHPDRRREMDFRGLGLYFSRRNLKTFINGTTSGKQQLYQSFKNDFGNFFRYVVQDIRYTCSLKPWQSLLNSKSRQLLSTTPQPYQSALSSQLFLATALSVMLAALLKCFSGSRLARYASLIQTGAQWTIFIALLLQQLPQLMRAWQMRDQKENRMLLAGIPTAIVGRTLLLSKNFLALSGLNGIGSVLVSKGLAENSQKYRRFISYLQSIQAEAARNPEMTAQNVLSALCQEKRLQQLEQDFGKTRVRFLLQTLGQAQQAQRTKGLPLAAFLAPIAQANSTEMPI